MSSAELQLRIDRDVCQSAQACMRRAPGSFALDAQGKASAARPLRADEPTLLAAARACPNFAITVWRGDERLA